jgi:hypothetical protein
MVKCGVNSKRWERHYTKAGPIKEENVGLISWVDPKPKKKEN